MNALASLLGLILFTSTAGAVPFWGDKASRDAGTDPQRLKPGQFIWDAEAVRTGPVVLVVSLDEQLAYVYRNGIRVGVASVSTGRPGHTTPTGVFTILQKDKDHHSKKYDNAPMPYAERLTGTASRCTPGACLATRPPTAASTCRRSSRSCCSGSPRWA